MNVLVIVPCFNEEQSLPELLTEIRATGFDVVLVDDASTDGSTHIASTEGICTLALPVNLGIGGAVQTGFIYADRHGYDVVVQVDGDGQHDPAQIHALIEPIRQGQLDCVIGSRYLPGAQDQSYQTPTVRRMGMHFSTTLLHLTCGLKIYDTTSGFRALNSRAFAYFAKNYPTDHPEAEALLMLHQCGMRVGEIPVTMRQRMSGQSLFGFFKAAMYPLRVIVGFAGIVFSRARVLKS